MYFNLFVYYFVIFCSSYGMYKLINAAEEDINRPDPRLGKYTSRKFRLISYSVFLIVLICISAFLIVIDIPSIVSRDFEVYNGTVTEYRTLMRKKNRYAYDLVVTNNQNEKKIEEVYSPETLEKEMNIEISFPTTPFLKNSVIKINGQKTKYYEEIYKDNVGEKIGVCIYALLNLLLQIFAGSKVSNRAVVGVKQKIVLGIWKISSILYTFFVIAGVFGILGSVYSGILLAFSFLVYNVAALGAVIANST